LPRQKISQGSQFEEEVGYSRAVIDGSWVFVSGTTGFNYTDMTISDDVVEQVVQCFKNIDWALEQAECSFEDIVRVRFIVPDRSDFRRCWPVIRSYLGNVKPASTMISAGLADPRMKIEIEVTARKQSG